MYRIHAIRVRFKGNPVAPRKNLTDVEGRPVSMGGGGIGAGVVDGFGSLWPGAEGAVHGKLGFGAVARLPQKGLHEEIHVLGQCRDVVGQVSKVLLLHSLIFRDRRQRLLGLFGDGVKGLDAGIVRIHPGALQFLHLAAVREFALQVVDFKFVVDHKSFIASHCGRGADASLIGVFHFGTLVRKVAFVFALCVMQRRGECRIGLRLFL